MALPSSHILPSSAFRHIGFMVLFMAVIAGFSALGLLAVQTITKSWIQDTQNKMTLEILAFDEHEKSVFNQQRIEQNFLKIQKIIDGDPIITNTDVTRFDDVDRVKTEYAIPNPVFMTLSLHPDRVENAEQRIIDEITQHVPHTIFKRPEIWQADINRTALTLRFAFISLAVGVFFVTSLILSATIRTQLQASDQTIKLIHLMGANPSIIAGLFQRALIKPIIWGSAIGLVCVVASFSPALLFLNIIISPLLFYGYLGIIFVSFIVTSYVITSLTVRNALKAMP
jgi:cell division protein FtsX